jgi:hypothetical protein
MVDIASDSDYHSAGIVSMKDRIMPLPKYNRRVASAESALNVYHAALRERLSESETGVVTLNVNYPVLKGGA